MQAGQSASRNNVLEETLRNIPEGPLREQVRTQFLAGVTTSVYAAPEARSSIIQDTVNVLAQHLRNAGLDTGRVQHMINKLCGGAVRHI